MFSMCGYREEQTGPDGPLPRCTQVGKAPEMCVWLHELVEESFWETQKNMSSVQSHERTATSTLKYCRVSAKG